MQPVKTHKFDLVATQFKRDPAPTFAQMRALGPVLRTKFPMVGDMWVTTTYAAATDVLKSKNDFVQEPRHAGRRSKVGIKWWMPRSLTLLGDNMLQQDEPDHRRLRGLVDTAFQRQGVESMRPRIAAIADALLDDVSRHPAADLVEQFAKPLPLAVICELLGLPPQDRPKFMHWCERLTAVASMPGLLMAVPGIQKLIRYLRAQFESRRRAPRPDLITALVEAEEAGDKLSESELLSMVFLLLLAGHITTTHLIGVGTLALLEHPDQKRALLADWSRVAPATEELLRYISPVQFTKPRYIARDLVLHGQELKRGDVILAGLAAANCDPAAFDRPDRLDLARSPNPHLAFSTGIHFCLGLQLARAEAQIAFERLFTRFPDLELAVPAGDLKWTRNWGLRALQSLPVMLAGRQQRLRVVA